MAEEVTQLITAITAFAVGVVLPAMGFYMNYIRSRQDKMSDRQKKTVDVMQEIVNSIEATDRWVLDNQGKIDAVVEIATKSPEFKKLLDENKIDIERWRADTDQARKDITALYEKFTPKPDDSSKDDVVRDLSHIQKKLEYD